MKSTWKNISRKCEMWNAEKIWKQGSITIQTCKSPRHGKCNSPKWKAQILKLEMGNFKAGNIQSESWKWFRKSQTWKMSKFQNQTLQNGKSKSENRKCEISESVCLRKIEKGERSKFPNQPCATLQNGKSKSESRKCKIWKQEIWNLKVATLRKSETWKTQKTNLVQLCKMESPNLKAQEMQNLKAGNMKSESCDPQKVWDMENVENKPCATLQNGKSNLKLEMWSQLKLS